MIKYDPTEGFVTLASGEEGRGAYVAWLLSPESAKNIAFWAKMQGVPKVVDPRDMHCTVMYSPNNGVDPTLHGDHSLRTQRALGYCNPRTEVLGKPGNSAALVTTFDSNLICARHQLWKDEHNLEHAHPQFIPHVTLSYDASSVPHDVFRRMRVCPCPLPLIFDRERVAYCN